MKKYIIKEINSLDNITVNIKEQMTISKESLYTGDEVEEDEGKVSLFGSSQLMQDFGRSSTSNPDCSRILLKIIGKLIEIDKQSVHQAIDSCLREKGPLLQSEYKELVNVIKSQWHFVQDVQNKNVLTIIAKILVKYESIICIILAQDSNITTDGNVDNNIAKMIIDTLNEIKQYEEEMQNVFISQASLSQEIKLSLKKILDKLKAVSEHYVMTLWNNVQNIEGSLKEMYNIPATCIVDYLQSSFMSNTQDKSILNEQEKSVLTRLLHTGYHQRGFGSIACTILFIEMPNYITQGCCLVNGDREGLFAPFHKLSLVKESKEIWLQVQETACAHAVTQDADNPRLRV